MRHAFVKLSAFASFALLALAGCTASKPEQPPASGACNAEAAQRLVGQARPNDAEAMRQTGATSVRQIAPGDPVTMDFRQERVTIETDKVTGRVTRAMCG